MTASSGDIASGRENRDDPLRKAARLLYDELAHAGFSAVDEWDYLPNEKQEPFIECMEGLLMQWKVMTKARAFLEVQGTQ